MHSGKQPMSHILKAGLLALMLAASVDAAAQTAPRRIRGTVEQLDGNTRVQLLWAHKAWLAMPASSASA